MELLRLLEGEEGGEGRETQGEDVAVVLDGVHGGRECLRRSSSQQSAPRKPYKGSTHETSTKITLGDALVGLLRLERQLDPPRRPDVLISFPPAELGLRVVRLLVNDNRRNPLSLLEQRREPGKSPALLVLVVALLLLVGGLAGRLEARGVLG